MATCPILSRQQITTQSSNIDISLPTFNSYGGDSIGSLSEGTGELTMPSISLFPDNSISLTIPELMFVGNGTIDEVECIQGSCGFWDEENSVCGIAGISKSIAKISGEDTSVNLGTFKTLFESVIGDESSNSKLIDLVQLFKDTIGESSDIDTGVGKLATIVKKFSDIVGDETAKTTAEGKTIIELLSGDNKLLDYLKTMIGTEDEKQESSLIQSVDSLGSLKPYFEDVLGTNDDKNEEQEKVIHLTKILNLFRDVIGQAEERDEESSLITYLQNVLGKKENFDENINMSLLWGHIHKQHYHSLPHRYDIYDATVFGQAGGKGSIPKAAVLANEFMTREDLDGNELIYGKDFKIADDENKPVMLYGLETHPQWLDPGTEISWEEYMSSFE